MTFHLEPLEQVEVRADHYVATGEAPWLRLRGRLPLPGSWFRISYVASYLDHCVRPLVRYEGVDEWGVMRAPYFGRADWIGHYPEGAQGISISPVNKAGPFRFVVEDLQKVFLPRLYLRAFKNDPKTALMSVGARIIGAKKEMRQALMFARGGIKLSNYDSWRRKMTRAYDPTGLDAPYALEDDLPHIRLVSDFKTSRELRGSNLWRSVNDESYRKVSFALPSAGGETFSIVTSDRNKTGSEEILTAKLTEGLRESDLLAFVPANAVLSECALACVGQIASHDPDGEFFYGDGDALENGSYHSPRLLPDWSRRLQKEVRYVREPIFCRANLLEREGLDIRALLFKGNTDTVDPKRVAHVRRSLVTLQSPQLETANSTVNLRRRAVTSAVQMPSVSIIIPSKDRIDLIRACLTSVQAFSDPLPDEIIIVDNDSDLNTFAYYASVQLPGLRVVRQPGSFNFSKMCNAGAKIATGDVIIFMNNDVEAVDRHWMSPLIGAALDDDVGVAGPLLLFPNGRIQHAGVVVGMGGYADHVFQGEERVYSGYLNTLAREHEVSAVTGAVMAIQRRRFLAAGGFNELEFPVELNDIDLCLRLNALGLQTVLCPESKLIHRQSSSRGFRLRPFTSYAFERTAFRRRWTNIIRDDIFYHPAMSLFSTRVRLDG